MSTKSPLERVKQEFGGKDKLVDKLVGLIDAGDESKDDLRKVRGVNSIYHNNGIQTWLVRSSGETENVEVG